MVNLNIFAIILCGETGYVLWAVQAPPVRNVSFYLLVCLNPIPLRSGLLLSVDTKVTKKSLVPYGASGMSKFSFAGGKRKFNAIHCAYQKEDIEAMHPWTLLGYKKRT